MPAGRKKSKMIILYEKLDMEGKQSSLTQRTKGPEKESTRNSNTLRYSRRGNVTMLEAQTCKQFFASGLWNHRI